MMKMLDACGRALVDCLRPRILGITLMPLGLMLLLGFLLSYFYGAAAVERVSQWLDGSGGWSLVGNMFSGLGIENATAIVAPIIVFLVASTFIAVLSLLLIGALLMPVMVSLVKNRRFPQMAAFGKDSLLRSLWWSFVSTLIALAAIAITLPLWLLPPLAFIIPPLIWGWLAYRMLSFDALAKYASANERQMLMQQHRWPLLLMGVICGYLSAAPSIIWASGVVFAVAFPLLVPLGIWIYTMVFAFSALWFTHYCLKALYDWRLTNGYDLEAIDDMTHSRLDPDEPPVPRQLEDARIVREDEPTREGNLRR